MPRRTAPEAPPAYTPPPKPRVFSVQTELWTFGKLLVVFWLLDFVIRAVRQVVIGRGSFYEKGEWSFAVFIGLMALQCAWSFVKWVKWKREQARTAAAAAAPAV